MNFVSTPHPQLLGKRARLRARTRLAAVALLEKGEEKNGGEKAEEVRCVENRSQRPSRLLPIRIVSRNIGRFLIEATIVYESHVSMASVRLCLIIRHDPLRPALKTQTGQVPDEEVRSFISSRRLELEDHPRLLSGLAAQLTPSFCDAKVEAIRLANEVSPVAAPRVHHANLCFEDLSHGVPWGCSPKIEQVCCAYRAFEFQWYLSRKPPSLILTR